MFIPGKPTISIRDIVNTFNKDNRVANHENIFFFSCGREALLFGLKLMPLTKENKVWFPAYICKSALNPILHQDVGVVFYDVTSDLRPDFDTFKPQKGDIVLIVHYFGVIQQTGAISEIKEKYKAWVIEDCAHTLPSIRGCRHRGAGDVSVYSLRKVLAVPDGGVLTVNNTELSSIACDYSTILRTTHLSRFLLMIGEGLSFNLGINVLRVKDGLANGMSEDERVDLRGISRQTLGLLKGVDLRGIVQKRTDNYNKMSAILSGIKEIHVPFKTLSEGLIPQVFPVWCKNPRDVVVKLRRRGIEAYCWPGRELPLGTDMRKYTGTREWVEKAVLLPVHHCLGSKHIERITSELRTIL